MVHIEDNKYSLEGAVRDCLTVEVWLGFMTRFNYCLRRAVKDSCDVLIFKSEDFEASE